MDLLSGRKTPHLLKDIFFLSTTLAIFLTISPLWAMDKKEDNKHPSGRLQSYVVRGDDSVPISPGCSSSLSSDINSSSVPTLSCTEVDLQKAIEIFPHLIGLEQNGKIRYLTREYWFGGDPCHQTKFLISSKDIDYQNINKEYMKFKKDNELGSFRDGRELIFQNGSFYCEGKKVSMRTFDFLDECRYIIDENYRLFVSQTANHSQLVMGQYVLCAGIVKFDETGKICYIDNATGHICSNDFQRQDVIRYLWNRGMLAQDAITSEWNALGSPVECSDFLKQKIDRPGNVLIFTDKKTDSDEATASPSSSSTENKRSLARQVLDVTTHKKAELRVEEQILSFDIQHFYHGPSSVSKEDLQKQKEQLTANRPHKGSYDTILAARDYVEKQKRYKRVIDLGGEIPPHLWVTLTSPEQSKKLRDESLLEAKQELSRLTLGVEKDPQILKISKLLLANTEESEESNVNKNHSQTFRGPYFKVTSLDIISNEERSKRRKQSAVAKKAFKLKKVRERKKWK